jgi:hypothetical protein
MPKGRYSPAAPAPLRDTTDAGIALTLRLFILAGLFQDAGQAIVQHHQSARAEWLSFPLLRDPFFELHHHPLEVVIGRIIGIRCSDCHGGSGERLFVRYPLYAAEAGGLWIITLKRHAAKLCYFFTLRHSGALERYEGRDEPPQSRRATSMIDVRSIQACFVVDRRIAPAGASATGLPRALPRCFNIYPKRVMLSSGPGSAGSKKPSEKKTNGTSLSSGASNQAAHRCSASFAISGTPSNRRVGLFRREHRRRAAADCGHHQRSCRVRRCAAHSHRRPQRTHADIFTLPSRG